MILLTFSILFSSIMAKSSVVNLNVNTRTSYVSHKIENSKYDIKQSKGERECRDVLEIHFKKKFNRCRPNFLKNPNVFKTFFIQIY